MELNGRIDYESVVIIELNSRMNNLLHNIPEIPNQLNRIESKRLINIVFIVHFVIVCKQIKRGGDKRSRMLKDIQTCHLRRIMNFFNLSVQMRILLDESSFCCDNHTDSKHCLADNRSSFLCSNRLEMNSFAFCETVSNASSSKS